MNTPATTDHFIANLYTQTSWISLPDVFARIDYLTTLFMEKPYISAPQGEGANTSIDQAPLYRFDAFDCVTFMNNILALALSNDLISFQKNLLRINYYHAKPLFENRFHFMSIDWNPQNQKNKIVVDVTEKISGKNGEAIVDFAQGEIDRPGWFLKQADNKKSDVLRVLAAQVKKEWVSLPYLPLTQLFDQNKNPNDFLFQQIQSVSIIEIVRPNWALKEKIGTDLHVSHVGFAVRDADNVLWFRHASSELKKVVSVRFSDYLADCTDSPTIKGINVQKIL